MESSLKHPFLLLLCFLLISPFCLVVNADITSRPTISAEEYVTKRSTPRYYPRHQKQVSSDILNPVHVERSPTKRLKASEDLDHPRQDHENRNEHPSESKSFQEGDSQSQREAIVERSESHKMPREASVRSDDQKTNERPVRPFSALIEDERFYGGLITYSHRLHPAKVCRVMNACLRDDNTLLVPEWMQRHDQTLRFQCGHDKIEFSLRDTAPPPALKSFDLVGLHSPRPSMPDFIQDFLPNAVIFDLIYGDHTVSKSCHSRIGKDCSSFPGLEEGFKPAIILPSRLRTLEEKKSWVHQFVRLMKPPHSGKHAITLYDDGVRNEDSGVTCFRSALFTRGPFNKNFIMREHLRQIHFLERHGILKPPRFQSPPENMMSHGEEYCPVNLTITNRKLVDGAHNRLIGRYILNVPALREALLRQAEKIPGLDLKVSTMCLEGKSLRWQINAMQKTDVWVGGNGPLLTNMIFLRENSTVVEIQPFAYYPQDYERIADRLAHVSYERYIADPDLEAFRACINHFYDESHPAYGEASAILDRFTQASAKFYENDNTHSLVLHTLNDEDMQQVKYCAQMQRLTTNPRNLAAAVVRLARLKCGLPKPDIHRDYASKKHRPTAYRKHEDDLLQRSFH